MAADVTGPRRLGSKVATREALRPRPSTLLKTWSDSFPWLASVIYLSSGLYFIVQIAVARVWTPAYSWRENTISDLGNTSCSPALCSPRHALMNAELWLLGLAMVTGSLLAYQDFNARPAVERVAARIGFGCLALGGVGTVVVGLFPENTVGVMHVVGAGLAIFVGTLGILVLGFGIDVPVVLRWGMRIIAPIAMVALLLFAAHVDLGMGAGTMERIAAYPETVWLVLFGISVLVRHSFCEPAGP